MKEKEIKRHIINKIAAAAAPSLSILESIKITCRNNSGILKQSLKTVRENNVKPKAKTKMSGRKVFGLVSVIAAAFVIVIMGAILIPGWLGSSYPNGTTAGLEYKLIDNSFYEVSIGKAKDKDIIIASEYKGLPVNRIAKNGFSKTDIKSVTMPVSITSIDAAAFAECKLLEKIEIPNSVTSIGSQAFSDCSSLTSIKIPGSVTTIGSKAFEACNNLIIYTEVTNKPSGWNNDWNFSDRPVIWAETPDPVVWAETPGLAYTLINKGTEYSVWLGDANAADIYIPAIYKGLPVTNIGGAAFANCTSLKSITIPSSVTSIGGYAFYGCTNLESVIIPANVTSIGGYAFYGCTNLERITIPASLTDIFAYAFYDTAWFNNQPDGLVYLNKILYAYKGDEEDVITINNIRPDTISIAYGVFAYCENLTSITIPTTVTSIQRMAFVGCTSLESIIIPASVTSIGDGAFAGCTNLANITTSSSLMDIGQSVFHGTAWFNNKPDGLVYLNKMLYAYKGDMPEGTVINNISPDTICIAYGVFAYCENLKSITIPDSVISIGEFAFAGCTSLESITIPANVINIGMSAFSGCANLKSIIIHANITNIGSFMFAGCTSLESIVIPASVSSIDYYAFAYCVSLESIMIPASVNSIDELAFYGCTSLESIIIPATVTYIGKNAFIGCDSLIIYAKAASQPGGWDITWNSLGEGAYVPVVWGYAL